MNQVTSPTCHRTTIIQRHASRLAVGVVSLGLVLTSSVGSANAENLNDRRDDVRAAIVATKKQIASAKADVNTATAKLEKSQSALSKAQRQLITVTGKLEKARELDRAIGVRLAAAQARLKASQHRLDLAKSDVAKGSAEVVAQRARIGEAVRAAYQQQSTLVGYTVALGAESTADLAQRLQWTTTIMDSTAAQMARLKELLAKLQTLKAALQERRNELAADEADVANEKAAAARQVGATAALVSQAAGVRTTVAKLVVANAKARRAAMDDLAGEQREYDQLRAEDARIGAEIKRRAEIARKKRLAAIARAKALAAKKNKKYVAPAESNKGFVMPVNAKPGSPFGMRYHPILKVWRMHRGTDFGAPCGAPLFAVADARVASARWQGGFGNYTVLDVGFINGRYVSVGYAHQSRMIVRAGQRVRQGQVIGYVGTTGLSTGCHLHFQVYVNGAVVNPMSYL